MAYVIRHRGKDGIVNVERVCGMVREKLSKELVAVASKEHRAASATHKDAANEDSERNGFTGKKKLFRRVARIPASEWRGMRKAVDPGDWNAMKGFIKENGYHTVARNSF